VIVFLARLVRLLLVLFLLRLLLRFVAAVVAGYRGHGRPAPRVEEMVRDRVCDTFVPRARALVAMVDGREQHFCSARCRDRALALRPSAP